MSATDIITISLLILGILSAFGIYFGMKTEKPGITFAFTMVGYFSTLVLLFIMLVSLATVVVADTLG